MIRFALVALLVALPALSLAPTAIAGPVAPGYDHVAYLSSVDGFNLSYDEYLPAGFSNGSTYPLVLYLHGAGSSTTPVPGGTNQWQSVVTAATVDGATERGIIQNASAYGYILAILNTRTSAGFFANTKCGGPQEQDVLDAIASEQSRHSISNVSLIGFSMGGMGAFAVAGHNPGLIRAIAVAAVASDIYEDYAYLEKGGRPASHDIQENLDNCGVQPSPKNQTVDESFFDYLSPRFYTQNFSGIRVWGSGGGRDVEIPDNLGTWPYLEANASFVNSSCRYEPKLGEPSGCTTNWPSLNATLFPYRFDFEPRATHDMDQLVPAQIFAFWGLP